jgi:hypothetical protein
MTIRIANESKRISVLSVGNSGAEFTTIEAALASITDNDTDNRYVVEVDPGIFPENNPIQLKEYVDVVSKGGSRTTRIVAQNGSADLFTAAIQCNVKGFTLYGVTGASNYAVEHSAAGFFGMQDIGFGDCSNGIHINNATASAELNGCAVVNPLASAQRGVHVEAGNVILNDFSAPFGTVDSAIDVTGLNSVVTINHFNAFNASLTTGIKVSSGARIVANACSLVGMTDGIVIDGQADVRLIGVTIFNAQNDGLRVTSTEDDVYLSFQACTIEDSTQFDINLLQQSVVVSGFCQTSVDKLNYISGVQMYGLFIDLKEADEGTRAFGELHVGQPNRGAESVFGEGDSYTRGMLVYTETDLGVFADVSEDAKSASGSTFTFPGVAADNAIYIASSLENGDKLIHHGIKASISTAGVLGSGKIIAEYWNGTDSWVELNGMVTDSDVPFLPYGKDYFSRTGGFQIRYDIQEMNGTGWGKGDPMSLGTEYYWIRFRIVTAITTAPIFQQFKLHPSRGEINADGFNEFFGNARPYRKLDMSVGTGKPVEGNMQDQTIYMDQNVGVGYTKNKFTALSDIYGWSLVFPNSIDTSSKIAFRFAGLASVAETIQFTIRWSWQSPDGTMYVTEPAGGSNPNTKNTTASKLCTVNGLSWFSAELDISDFISRRDVGYPDGMMLTIQPSTMSGTFSLAKVQAYHLDWCSGGHAD